MATIRTKTFKLFVYGTLMRGHLRAGTLRNETFLREVDTDDGYDLLDLQTYPGLIRVSEGGRKIHGELFEVTAELVPVLDRIEGSPNLFRLERVNIVGEEEPVYAYFFKYKIDNPRRCENPRWEGI